MLPMPIYRHTIERLRDQYRAKLLEYHATTQIYSVNAEGNLNQDQYFLIEDRVSTQHQKNVLDGISMLQKATAFFILLLSYL